jgi:signal transduction histidine kinase
MLTRARSITHTEQNETQQAKDDLLSLASHQLRTPATAVKQYLGIILEGYTGTIKKQQLQPLQKAYASNERQLETINQILYVAKADAGRLSVNRNIFNLNSLIKNVIADVSEIIGEKDQSIKTKLTRRKLDVFADEASIRMVIENLISNAGKYSGQGAKITVKSDVKDSEVTVSIADKGVGIKPADFDKLFKKFSRIDNDLSLQTDGSGIGLYISKVLVELHGGRIEVDSEEGKGTVFTIFLPDGDASNLTDANKKDGSL